jgi:probable HAF family extracellular repeat protein
MRRFSNVIALAVVALPVMGIVPGAQASIAARLRQFGGFAVAIMIFICFGIPVALAFDATNFHAFIAPVENETYFDQNNSTAIARGVNNAGVIVGEVDDSNGIRHGFYFRDGAVTEFNSQGATHTVASGINAGDVIVGSRFDATNGWQAFFASPGVSNPFKYPNSTHTFAAAINDNKRDRWVLHKWGRKLERLVVL